MPTQPGLTKILMLLLTVSLCCVLISIVTADDTTTEATSQWSVWLCSDPDTAPNECIQVNQAGDALQKVNLAALTTSGIMPGTMQFSESGRFLAFVTQNSYQRQVRVYDVLEERMRGLHVLEYPEFIPTRPVFNAWERKLAFGAVLAEDGGVGIWQILVTDIKRGEIKHRLDSGSPLVPVEIRTAHEVMVQHFDNYRVYFTVKTDADDRATPGYVWDVLTNTVTENVAYSPMATVDIFTKTGETLMVLPDERLPGYENGANAVHVYDPFEDRRYPFFTSAYFPIAAFFVQNGQRVLVHGTDDTSQNVWFLVTREGQITRFLRQIERKDVFGTAEGFVYLFTNADGDSELIAFDSQRAFSDRSVWKGVGAWQILWASSETETYGAFTAWSSLEEAVYDAPIPHITIDSPMLPPLPQVLHPGMEAIVRANGDVLYLRSQAGTGNEILQHLYDDDVVRLLEGPHHEDGYRWWRIRTAEGLEGWAVEAAGDITTLLPNRERHETGE